MRPVKRMLGHTLEAVPGTSAPSRLFCCFLGVLPQCGPQSNQLWVETSGTMNQAKVFPFLSWMSWVFCHGKGWLNKRTRAVWAWTSSPYGFSPGIAPSFVLRGSLLHHGYSREGEGWQAQGSWVRLLAWSLWAWLSHMEHLLCSQSQGWPWRASLGSNTLQ